MKSALCLLSGKSCARLIEMFIRQIYRDGKEERGAGGTTGSGCAQQARQGLLGGDLRPAQKEQERGRSRWAMPARRRATDLTHRGQPKEGGCQLNCCLCEDLAHRVGAPPAHFWECPFLCIRCHFLCPGTQFLKHSGPVHLPAVKARG